MMRFRLPMGIVVTIVGCAWGAGRATAQTVRWITPPPAAVQSGGLFTVQWEVTGFGNDPLDQNAVAWGIRSVIGQTDPQLNGDCVYTATVPVPVVATSGTLLYVPFASSVNDFAFAEPRPVRITLGPAAATYFPDAAGSAWTYLLSDMATTSTYVMRPGVGEINCEAWRGFEDYLNGVRWYMSVTAAGVRNARVVYHDTTVGRVEATWAPPFRLAGPDLVLGAQVQSMGTLTYVPEVGAPITVPYAMTSTVAAFEPVAVPAGVFDTVRLEVTHTAGADPPSVVSLWYAPGVGLVKVAGTAGTLVSPLELLATNLP